MAHEISETEADIVEDVRIASSAPSSSSDQTPAELLFAGDDQSFSRSGSFRRLNAGAPEFVPGGHSPTAKIHQHPSPPSQMINVFHSSSPTSAVTTQVVTPGPSIGGYESYAGGVGGPGEQDYVQVQEDPDMGRDWLSDDVVQKVTKQVEYYFSDANLATTEHLMRFITKDPEGFVPISVIASFKKIKAMVHNNVLLANALRTSTKLMVSDDGKKVRRTKPFTEADVEELQARIVVAENLPEDHCYHNLMKIFSAVGNVKTIRTCYPQTPNGTTNPTNRSSKLDMLFANKLHAFVEYETVEDAEKAAAALNDERNWRSGLRLRTLNKCVTKFVASRGRKAGHEGDGAGDEEDVFSTNQHAEKQPDDQSQPAETSFELAGDEGFNERESGGGRRGGGRGRGRGRARGRGHYHNTYSHYHGAGIHGHPIGTPPSGHPVHNESPPVAKPPPGPRMPDGTRGFAMGRGKPTTAPPSTSYPT